ncbi:unnamed protein product [Ilex paraguariensis]|uniref:rhamnogalacturonan endolyase n=1 Tax=Ilex paraguariensis TaxID=185542 RepID=A0ABC8UZX4_9AQUA
MSSQGVELHVQRRHVVMDNGILKVTLSKPGGIVTGIKYSGIDNLLEVINDETNRGYWDIVWSPAGSTGTFERIETTSFKVIMKTEEQVEVLFSRTWDASLEGKLAPLNIDKRFILLRGCSGFYSYAIYEHLKEWPGFNLDETRIAFKLRKDKFHYMAMADNRQRYMPLPDDRLPERGQPLAYPEAVLLVNPVEPEFQGEVDDKYQYSCENKDLKVHGWICMDPPVGFWQITPSDEFRSGGPLKQNLTSHVGPTALAVFLSAHYAGDDLVLKFKQGEPWKKVFGPIFIYLNTIIDGEDPLSLWEDAKDKCATRLTFLTGKQMMTEVQSWPYNFPASEDFQSSLQRGSVSGRLLVRDRYISEDYISKHSAYVGLAPPGDVGSWQRECKVYQFWTRSDEEGYFSINDIRSGDYNLYAWVTGFIGDYRCDVAITITPGCDIDMGDLVYDPPRDGPTLWEIGIPDRSAAEYYVPDPNPKYINKLLVNHPDRFRQYGLWERYAELYPNQDLVYTVGESDYQKDWFFAQVTRKKDDQTYQATTWQIKFKLENVNQTGKYTLRLALASAAQAELQVRINDPNPSSTPLFSSGIIGRDNAIARHGIHGLYWLFNVDIVGHLLVQGGNIVYLTQAQSTSPFQGIMYDYIRLEASLRSLPSKSRDSTKEREGNKHTMLCLFLYEPIRKHYKLSSFKLLAFFIQILLIRNLLLFGYQNRIFLCAEEVTRASCGLKSMSATGVQLHIQDDHVLIGNGVLQITLTNPGGILRGIEYGGIDNLLELHNKDLNGGIEGTSLEVVVENEEQVELSFTRVWDSSVQGKQAPLYIDRRFVMLRGSSGFYSYAIFEHLRGYACIQP